MKTIETEIWKDIAEYEGVYQISNLGSVKSLSRIVLMVYKNRESTRLTQERIIVPYLTESGYWAIKLFANNRGRCFLIHRLIATHFISNPENKREVNHLSGIKTDNRIENLEWCSSSENKVHAHKIGLMVSPRINAGKFGSLNTFAKAVLQINIGGKVVAKHGSIVEAAAYAGVTENVLYYCMKINKLINGYMWKRAALIPLTFDATSGDVQGQNQATSCILKVAKK